MREGVRVNNMLLETCANMNHSHFMSSWKSEMEGAEIDKSRRRT